MTLAFPWSGRDVNARVQVSGRAATPGVPSGAGFNWSSMVGNTVGWTRPRLALSGLGQGDHTVTRMNPTVAGRLHPNATGIDVSQVFNTPASWALKRRGIRGLGQDVGYYDSSGNWVSTSGIPSADVIEGGSYQPPSGPNPTQVFLPSGAAGTTPSMSPVAGGASGSANAPWYASLLSNAITAGLQTGSTIASYQLNPLYQKQTYVQTPQGIIATNQPTTSIPGITTTTASMMPLLLLGGAAVVLMMMMRGRS